MAEMHSPACYVLKVFNDNAITCKLKCGHHPRGEGRSKVSLSCTINCWPHIKKMAIKPAVVTDSMLVCVQST